MAELMSFSPSTQKSELPHGTRPTSGKSFANGGQSTLENYIENSFVKQFLFIFHVITMSS